MFGGIYAFCRAPKMGNFSLINEEIRESFTGMGNMSIQNVIFHERAVCSGNCNIRNSEWRGEVNFSGNVQVVVSSFRNLVRCSGVMDIQGSTFDRELYLFSERSSFDSTKMKDLFVQVTQPLREQSIHLTNGTSVERIIFEAGRGKVFCDQTSTVGEIQGGERVHEFIQHT